MKVSSLFNRSRCFVPYVWRSIHRPFNPDKTDRMTDKQIDNLASIGSAAIVTATLIFSYYLCMIGIETLLSFEMPHWVFWGTFGWWASRIYYYGLDYARTLAKKRRSNHDQ